MFLLANISWFGLIAVVLVAGCGLRCVSHRPWRTIPVMLLGALAVIGGVRLIHSRSDSSHDSSRSVARQWRESIHEEVQERVRDKIHRDIAVRVVPPHVDVPEVRVELPQIEFGHDFPFDHEGADFHVTQTRADTSNLMLVALGAVLVIGGVMLFARGRMGGAVLKAVTLVGLIAAGSILYSNFTSPLHYPVRTVSHSTDRVIKDTDDDAAAPAAPAPPVEPARPRRAKRPMERSAGPTVRDQDELPPRAGEIPVAAELASGVKVPEAGKACRNETCRGTTRRTCLRRNAGRGSKTCRGFASRVARAFASRVARVCSGCNRAGVRAGAVRRNQSSAGA